MLRFMSGARKQRHSDQVGVVARVEAGHIRQLCEPNETTTYEIRLRQSPSFRNKMRRLSVCSIGYMLAPVIAVLHLLKR